MVVIETTVELTRITSRECAAYLERGGDLALVPVGGFERTGPHLPLAARGYVAIAIAELFARRCGGLRLPFVAYTPSYPTRGDGQSIHVAPDVAAGLCVDIADQLVQNGFKRILFVGWMKEFYYIISEYFQRANVAIAWINPDAAPPEGQAKLAAQTAAALELCGRLELAARVVRKSAEVLEHLPERARVAAGIDALGHFGRVLDPGEYLEYPCGPIDIGRTISELERWVIAKKDAVEALAEYNDEIARASGGEGI